MAFELIKLGFCELRGNLSVSDMRYFMRTRLFTTKC